MQTLLIKRKATVEGRVKLLPSSKSLSNRALVLGALAGDQSVVSNLSSARDTVLMNRLIGSGDPTIDVMDAGTTMRFLTGYFSIKGLHKTLTGSARMKERPIGLLVSALQTLGVEIGYLEKEGFPPIEIRGFRNQKVNELEMPGNVSSQYISSLMMVAPVLPQGLTIRLTGPVGSRPYIEMTAALMRHFGAVCHFEGSTIQIPSSTYTAKPYRVEGDWSGASYWFSFLALSKTGAVQLDSVTDKSLQGDRAIVDVMDKLGVRTTFNATGALLEKKEHASRIEWNFAQCPDLAQTVLPVCAAKGIEGYFTGLESLRIKETDRILALQEQLSKLGCRIIEETGHWILTPGDGPLPANMVVETYHDHRMAMGLAPLATLMDLEILDPSVVNKSYPTFWDDVRGLNFDVKES